MASNPFLGNSYGSTHQPDTQGPSYPSYKNAEQEQNIQADAEAVDLDKYPEPKDSTEKIRGWTDILEWFRGPINRQLLIAKLFYFFFFSAFASLLPLMAIYFKNLGMSPTQAGILIGIRPFVGYLSAPFWADLADRFRKGRLILLCSLAAWIVFNVPLGYIGPPTTSCLVHNGSEFIIDLPAGKTLVKRSIQADEWQAYDPDSKLGSNAPSVDYPVEFPWQQLLEVEEQNYEEMATPNQYVRKRREIPMKPNHEVGKSPYTLEFAANYDPARHSQWVSPTFSYTIYELQGVRKVFFLFLLLIVVGEFFCCPSITLADTAVLNMLGKDNAELYGRQRMFASLGWGLTMFIICLILDNSHSFSNHPCQVHERERNYSICYTCFTIFMLCTIAIATRLPFDYENTPEDSCPESGSLQIKSPTKPANPSKPVPPPPGQQPKSSEVIGDALKNILGKSKVFAQTTRRIPEWMPVLRHFANLNCASFMFVAWFMGFGIGLIFTFLFWHLQDFGGTSSVFGIASVVNHISEVLAYFLSFPLIRKIGHIKVLCLGLVGNVFRFLYISYLTEPWGVIPFELIQGVTHSAVWAAACSYITHNTPPELRASAQGVLQFIHHGLGRACGTIFGGVFSTAYGTTAVLRGYGFACIVVLVLFMAVTFYHKDKGFSANFSTTEDPRQVAEEMTHLAPHGVPTNPTIPRTPSNMRGPEENTHQEQLNYGGPNLEIPDSTKNPFVKSPQEFNNSYGASEYTGITMNAAPHQNIPSSNYNY